MTSGVLLAILLMLILLSAFFSSAETSLMAINRYRLRHAASSGKAGALRVERLLKRPDRLIGVVLLGNNLVNILASAIATILAMRQWGNAGVAIGSGLLTVVILVFSEVTPKTLAALHPERIAYPASVVLLPLMWLLFPLVYLVNGVSNGLLRLVGVRARERAQTALSVEEMKSVLYEAGRRFEPEQRDMLVRVLDLAGMVVADVMIPRGEVEFIDLADDPDELAEQLAACPYSRLPVAEGSLDQVVGMIELRRVVRDLGAEDFGADTIRAQMQEPLFVPQSTSLTQQALNFRDQAAHLGLVVNEYGDVQGIVTLEDIVEEIVGDFTDKAALTPQDIVPQPDGSWLIDGSALLREINRQLGWDLPTDGPRTLNGAILDYLQDIPSPGVSILLAGYPVEIVQTRNNAVKVARMVGPLKSGHRSADDGTHGQGEAHRPGSSASKAPE